MIRDIYTIKLYKLCFVLSLYLSELTLKIGALTSLSNLCKVLVTLVRDASTLDRDSCNFLAKSIGNCDVLGFGLLLLLAAAVVNDDDGAVAERAFELFSTFFALLFDCDKPINRSVALLDSLLSE